MNQITINRLIGGGVLVFASALFVPAILSPTTKSLQNPVLSGAVKEKKSLATKVKRISLTSEVPAISQNTVTKPLSLESLSDPVKKEIVSTEPPNNSKPEIASKKKLMPVSLESVGASVTKKASSVAAKKTKTQGNDSTSSASWLRVGSFSTQENADKIIKALNAARYPVKLQKVDVGGKVFRRVLVGPFSDEKKMAKIMKGMKARGYNPSVQR